MSDEGSVKLTLAGQLTYSSEISLAQAVEVLALLTSGRSDPGGSPVDRRPNARLGGRSDAMSPRQALEASGARTNSEKIVAFAMLVARQSAKETFTVDDVKPLFRQARASTPGNLTRDLSAAIQNGWIADAEDSGEYYVVGKATEVLETGFESLKSRQNGGRSRSSGSRRSRRAVPKPEAFADAEVSPVIEGLIDYHKVKTKTDKYLWAVNAAKLLGVETVDNAELTWLTDQLGEGLVRNDLGSYFRGNHKVGFVNKNSEGRVRITPKGVDHLRGLTAEKA